MHDFSRTPVFLILTALSVSCGSSLPSLEPRHTTTGEAFKDDSTVSCSALRPQTEPDLMGWDSGSRLNLNTLRKNGVVAVRYMSKGCDVQLEVLSNCIGTGDYRYSAYSATDTKMARNAQELYAELPLGAAKLTGKLKGNKALRTDFMLVGMAMLPPGKIYKRSDLSGPDCNRATHVVSRIYLGGFAMASGQTQQLEAATDIFMASTGALRDTKTRRLFSEGNPNQCKTALEDGSEKPLCSVPLRIGLLPLDVKCPEGSEWDGKSCVRKVTKVICPAGTTWDARKQGCVPDVRSRPATETLVATTNVPSGSSPSGRGPDMVRIPGGTFQMGSNSGDDDEKPVHRVRVSTFEMDRTEVTVAQYAQCVKAGQCEKPDSESERANWDKTGREDHPVNSVDWNQAKAFCSWAGKRLPTEAEWEYAARGGGQDIIYPWGNQTATCDFAVMRQGSTRSPNYGCGKYRTWPVCSKTRGNTLQGLCDMAGNVWEWVSDWYGTYSSGSQSDPSGPGSGRYRVFRGGGWDDVGIPTGVRAADRSGIPPGIRSDVLGFRCARGAD